MTTVLIWWVAGVPLAVCLIAHLRAWLLGLSSRRAADLVDDLDQPRPCQPVSTNPPAVAPAVIRRHCEVRWRGGGAPLAGSLIRRGDCVARARRSPAA